MGLDMEMVMRLVSTCHKVSRIIQSSKRSKVLLTHISRATKNSCHSYCVALKYFNLVNRSRGPKAYFCRRGQALARQQMEAKKRKAPLLKKRFGGFSLSTASADCADQTSRVFVPELLFFSRRSKLPPLKRRCLAAQLNGPQLLWMERCHNLAGFCRL